MVLARPGPPTGPARDRIHCCRRRALPALASIAALAAPAAVSAQQVRRGTPPLDLPRPGYERHVTRLGPAELRLELEGAVRYDSNLFATSSGAQDDIAAILRPRAELDWRSATTEVFAEAYGEIREQRDFRRESATEFGAALGGSTSSRRHVLTTELRYDRAIESRADPEARAPIIARPREIDIFAGEAAYSLRGATFQFTVSPGFQRLDYRDPAERDRDLKLYRGFARLTWQPPAPVAVFAEVFVNHRDFDTATDLTGVNRDATTTGVLLGASREISGRLRGRIGAGVFHTDPKDASLSGFTGFAANGEVVWSPQARTAVTFQVFRGDVATVRAGASGRTDTRASVRIDQEARHNLLLNGRLGWTQSDFRGLARNRQDTFTAEAGAEYLVNRILSLFVAASVADRNADLPLREFARTRIEAGLRVRY